MIVKIQDFSNLDTVEEVVRFVSPFLNQVGHALNRNLNFNDNIRSTVQDVTFSASANTNLVVTHGLPATPIGFIPIQTSAACAIYNGSSLALGATFANLMCNVGGVTATILFF